MRPLAEIVSRAPKYACLALAAALALTACGGGRKITARVPVARVGTSEQGIASWYGEPYHGRRSANGEIFDMDKMTAAHPSLPFETWVSVHNLTNRKSTEVRITDRGPFVNGRIIDLSRAAARQIDLIGPGIAKVKITVIDPPRSYTQGREFTVQITSARDAAKAEQIRRQLAPQYGDVFVRYRTANAKGNTPEVWRILLGREREIRHSQATLERVRDRFPNAFVIAWDAE